MADAITATGLVKRYKTVTALDGVDLLVPTGSALGLLGPNGAGKTTIVRILTTLLQPDAGSATVAGVDVLAKPRDVRPTHRPVRSVRSRRRVPHRVREPRHDRPAVPPGGQALPRAAGAARGVPARGRCRPALQDLLGRDATPARPRGALAADLRSSSSTSRRWASTPGRTEDVGARSRTSSRRDDASARPPSTWRRRTSWRTTSSSSTMAGSSPRARRTRQTQVAVSASTCDRARSGTPLAARDLLDPPGSAALDRGPATLLTPISGEPDPHRGRGTRRRTIGIDDVGLRGSRSTTSSSREGHASEESGGRSVTGTPLDTPPRSPNGRLDTYHRPLERRRPTARLPCSRTPTLSPKREHHQDQMRPDSWSSRRSR